MIREEKLFRLIPGRTKNSRLEASGVALVNHTTALVVFDNLNQIARIEVSLKRSRQNRLWHAPSLGAGFEDVAADGRLGSTFGLIESVEDLDGVLRGFVAEYDHEGRLRRCTRLPGRFQKANKGFEGLAHARHNGREYLYALHEANSGSSSRGRIDVYAGPPTARGGRPAESRCPPTRGSRIIPRSRIGTTRWRSSRRSRHGCGWGGWTRSDARFFAGRVPCIAFRARTTAMSKVSTGCRTTP